jgi:RNA polymerase sigma factor (sigma-70 family)
VIERNMDTERQGEAVAAAVKVFAEHGGFMRNVIRLRVRDASRREDVFQELFLRLVDQPVPPDVQNIRGYLYRAILRDVVDLAREQENASHHLKKYARKNRIFIYKSPSQNAIIEDTEDEHSVFACLTRPLRRREREVVTLRYRDNCSIAEIADRMGIGKRTVSRYLTSALRQIRKTLATLATE